MTLKVNEVFYSIQGEGSRAGQASVFVRFAGCNQRCRIETHGFDCDTEHTSSQEMQVIDLVKLVDQIAGQCSWVVFTGGEPALQLTLEVVEEFRAAGYCLAIETNGTIDVSSLDLDFVTVSPKTAEHTIRQVIADEVKYVVRSNMALPKPRCKAPIGFLSPAWGPDGIDRDALELAVRLVKENPEWRLSLQSHKYWMVR